MCMIENVHRNSHVHVTGMCMLSEGQRLYYCIKILIFFFLLIFLYAYVCVDDCIVFDFNSLISDVFHIITAVAWYMLQNYLYLVPVCMTENGMAKCT